MSADRGDAAKRYLLGEADESMSAAFEEAIFHDDDALERAEAAEEALIEDYLEGRLTAGERQRFERHYLAVPHHRVRVEAVRRLRAAAATKGVPVRRHLPWLAAAAVLTLLAGGSWWFYSTRPQRGAAGVQTASSPGTAPRDRNLPAPAAPLRVFATSLSPIALRSAEDRPALVIPEGTDVVSLRLIGEGERPPAAARGVVRTVTGDVLWQGEATTGDTLPGGIVARIDVPASLLRPDDYIVELRTGPAGADRESYHYVLRVRSRP